jgi:hypothetical protein
MTTAAMLEQQMKRSEVFSKQNFGLECGSDFPEVVRDCLSSVDVCVKLLMNYIMQVVGAKDLGESIQTLLPEADSIKGTVNKEPILYKIPMEFFYWGIQIGRQLEKENAEALYSLEPKP